MKKRSALLLLSCLTCMSLFSCGGGVSSVANSSLISSVSSSVSSQQSSPSSESSSESSVVSSVLSEVKTITYFGETITLNKHAVYLDSSLKDEQLGSFAYNDIVKMAAAIEAGENENTPTIVYIAKGVYWVDDRTAAKDATGSATIGLELNKDFVRFYGMDTDASLTVIAGNRGKDAGCDQNWNVIGVGDQFQAKNLTIGNYCNIDLVYPGNTALSVAARLPSSICQAQTVVAMKNGEDKWAFENVRFMSRLNCIAGAADRVYFKGCHIECTDDSIQPGTHIVYENCDFDFYGKHPMWGSIYQEIEFLNCTFRGKSTDTGTFYFSKAPTNLALIDCKFEDNFGTIEWTNDIEEYPDLKEYIYNCKFGDKDVAISTAYPDISVNLADKEALKAYKVGTVYNSYNLLHGSDDWDPNGVKSSITGSENVVYRASLSVKSGEASLLTPSQTTVLVPSFVSQAALTTAPTYEVAVSDSTLLSAAIGTDGNITVTSASTIASITKGYVEITTADGIKARVYLDLTPAKVDAPTVKEGAAITVTEGKATLNYELVKANSSLKDMSDITWYRSDNATLEDTDQAVAVSRNDTPFASYVITEADVGKYLIAKLTARTQLSDYATTSTVVVTSAAVVAGQYTGDPLKVSTDFTNVPISNTKVSAGDFSFDTHIPADIKSKYWTASDGTISTMWTQFESAVTAGNGYGWDYAEGTAGSKGQFGMSNVGRGARMLYTPTASQTGMDMTMNATIYPAKTAGQGFGSAHGQYMDIFIGYDTSTLTGYSLRIQRETAYSDACLFGLYSFTNDVSTYISTAKTTVNSVEFEGLFAKAYNYKVSVSLSIIGNKLSATVTSDNNGADYTPADDNHKLSVSLEADLPSDRTISGGFGFMHTGTTSIGNRSNITNVEVTYSKHTV